MPSAIEQLTRRIRSGVRLQAMHGLMRRKLGERRLWGAVVALLVASLAGFALHGAYLCGPAQNLLDVRCSGLTC